MRPTRSRTEYIMAKSSKPLTKCKICGGSIQRRWSLGNPERQPWQHLDEDDWIDSPHEPEEATA